MSKKVEKMHTKTIETAPMMAEVDEKKIEEPQYERAYLQRRSFRIFGVGPHIVAGALKAAKLHEAQYLTIQQVKIAIDRFLRTSVRV